MKQITYAILVGILWLDLALIFEINGHFQGITKWIMMIFPILWFIMEAYFNNKYEKLLKDLFKLIERRTRLERSIK